MLRLLLLLAFFLISELDICVSKAMSLGPQKGVVDLFYLEEKLLKSNLLLKDKELEIRVLEKSLSNFKGERSGTVTVTSDYYPSSDYAKRIVGYRYGTTLSWKYPLLGELKGTKYKEDELKALVSVKKAEYEALKNKLLFELRRAYVDYYYSYTLEDKIKKTILDLEDIELKLKERYVNKLSLWTDILTVDTLITKLRASLSTIYETRLKSLAQIRSLVAEPFLPEFMPRLDNFEKLVNLYLPPASELVAFAQEHRKDIELLKEAYRALESGAREHSKAYPKAWFSVFGSLSSYDLDTFDSGLGISLTLSFPWKREEAERALLDERRFRAQREKVRLKFMKTELFNSIQGAVSNFEIFRDKYQAYRKEYEASVQTKKLFEKRVYAGLYSGSDALVKLASLLNREIGSYMLMMDSLKSMVTYYFSILKAVGVRELPWIVSSHLSENSLFTRPNLYQVDLSELITFAYVWSSHEFLGEPSLELDFLKKCKLLGLDGIYLSLNGKQIARFLKGERGKRKLLDFLSLAKREGLEVHLLLGENTWVFPENRGKLLSIVRLFNEFNKVAGTYSFDALHLDIEPHSLLEWRTSRKPLLENYLKTLSSVKEICRKPVFVDVPPKYLELPWKGGTLFEEVLRRVDGVNVMAYSTNLEELRGIARKLRRLSSLFRKPLVISLSFEEELPSTESFFHSQPDYFQRALSLLKEEGIGSVAYQNFKSFLYYALKNGILVKKLEPSPGTTPRKERPEKAPSKTSSRVVLHFPPGSSIPREIVFGY